MLPASLAADVPVFIATPTSAWARAGASLVPSPVIATSRPPSCSLRIRAILSSGVASARKSSTPASFGDRGGGRGVVAGDHHRADPHGPQPVEAFGHPRLDDVLEVDHAEHPGGLAVRAARDDERGAAGAGDPVDHALQVVRVPTRPATAPTRPPGSPAPLRTSVPSRSTPDIRVWAVNSTNVAPACVSCSGVRSRRRRDRGPPARRPSAPRASRRRGCRGRRPGRARAGSAPPTGMSSTARRLPSVMVPVLSRRRVDTSPAASTARPDMASTLRCTSRSIPAIPIAREQRADGGRDEADQQRDEDDDLLERRRSRRPSAAAP